MLNALVAVSLSIAVSGWLLRKRALAWQPRPARALSDGLYGGLIALTVASYVVKRVLSARTHRAEPGRRERLFYWSHIGPAILAALALPLGLVYGWLVIPQLEAVIPFWAVPLAFGFLSLPRQAELEGGGGSAQEPGSDSS